MKSMTGGLQKMEHLRNAELVEKIIFLIEKNLHSEKCLVEVEAIIEEDYPNYAVIFEEQAGMKPDEFIAKTRVGEAEKLLEQTEMDFKAIAKAIGINGYFEFTQLFKRLNGITPSGYRNQIFKALRANTGNA